MVAPVPFFPTPYPDETLYSAICRYWLKSGRPSYGAVSEELFGRKVILNTYVPQCIGVLTQKIPRETGLTPDYFIERTTVFPYFSPFLTQPRADTFLEYMRKTDFSKDNKFFALGTGKLRQPKSLYLRFCHSCRKEDVQKFAEPYWHRTHQLPGVLMCHRHAESLRDSDILISYANRGFYPASENLSRQGTICGNFTGRTAECLIDLSADSEWLLFNGWRFDPYETVFKRYELLFITGGFRGMHGRTRHKKVFEAIREYYGESFLKLIDAYDEYAESSWMARITHYPDNLLHPMYHILMIRLLKESISSFFEDECPEILPYGEGPWPCRNRVCPFHLQDVIETMDMHYHRRFYRAVFKCPHCGMAYRRKHSIPKEQQYSGIVYIKEYGPLWEAKLREYLVDLGLTPRETCRIMGCDFYTVNKYALRLGILSSEDVSFPKKRLKKLQMPLEQIAPIQRDNDVRQTYRKRWLNLIANNPGAIRSRLLALDPECHLWLRRNDLDWYEQHSHPISPSMDWNARDIENLEQIRSVVEALRRAEGKPHWINKNEIIRATGINQIGNNKALARLPLTAAYLAENLESIVEWRKRKIIWAIEKLRKDEISIKPHKIKIAASISHEAFLELYDFILECLELL